MQQKIIIKHFISNILLIIKKNELIDIDYEKIPFAKNEVELVNYWRKQMKLSVLSRIEDAEKTNKNEKFKKDANFQEKNI